MSVTSVRGGAAPLVSVIMPVRNAGALLRSAAHSIITQSWPHWELLVVDDHSSDGAPQQLRGLDPRIRVLPSPGRGIVAALNAGAAAAAGEFLARMDGDDIALPWRLETQLALLRDAPGVGIAGGRVEIFGGTTHLAQGYRSYQRWINALTTPQDIAREIFVESPIPHPTAMLRREVFDALGGYRDTPWAEDYDLWLRAYEAGVRMAKPRAVVLRWRDTAARLSRTCARYSQHNFLRAKAHFLARTGLRRREAVIWGAGPTGRRLCDALWEEGVAVSAFIEVHPRRIGGKKRGLPVIAANELGTPGGEMIIGAVGSRGARAEIRGALHASGRTEGEDFLFAA